MTLNMNHSITHSMQMTIPDGVPVDAERTCIIQLDKHSNVDWLTTWVQFWEPKCHIFVLYETSHKKCTWAVFQKDIPVKIMTLSPPNLSNSSIQ